MSQSMPAGAVTCKHAGCKCTVAAGQDFCSDHCRQAATQGSQGTGQPSSQHGCHCGHPPCR